LTDLDDRADAEYEDWQHQRELELAWAAGIFEGEGTVSAARPRTGLRIRAAVTQNGGEEAKALLERFVRAVGQGSVLGPYDYSRRYSASNLGTKPRYVVQYQTETKVRALMAELHPYLTPNSPKWNKYCDLLAEAQRESGGERTS